VERDARDRAREWGALSIADDATVIDTTEMTEERTIALICAIVAPA
jgi:cytidylate kinase